MIETPQVTEMPRATTAFIHLRIPREKMPELFGPTLEELFGALVAQDIEPAGPVFAHHLRMDAGVFDFELGVPVDETPREEGHLQVGERPAVAVARTVYRGPYEGLPAAWGEFDAWMEEEGCEQAPDLWETYLVGPDAASDPEAWRTELVRPLR
ncbi:MAG TPA: GyrI-like domain-containing protein [Longimicrobiales bacterium]|nr:GyrI-like domain-containing protein [Longimicrobiales bacterium]